jgi:hypothetical protein
MIIRSHEVCFFFFFPGFRCLFLNGTHWTHQLKIQVLQCGAPPVISWFLTPLTIDTSTINPNVIRVISQVSYLGGAFQWFLCLFLNGTHWTHQLKIQLLLDLSIRQRPRVSNLGHWRRGRERNLAAR